MQRCLQLAGHGAGYVSPNPMVGAVLVHQDRIIGEGWHERYGEAHAEVNCIRSVREEHKVLISESTLYVSLEPCAHQGKTAPCADLIIAHAIPRVVIACRDSFAAVNGKGIEKLEAAGITVTTGVLEKEARWLNRRFFTLQERHRPYVILKWAQSANGFIAPSSGERVMLSNPFSQHAVQTQRANEDALLIGYHTALNDNPMLSNRSGRGRPLCRMVTDFEMSLPGGLHIFDGSQPTVVFNHLLQANKDNAHWWKIDAGRSLSESVLDFAYRQQQASIIVEGGRKTLQQFIQAELWDEAYVYQTPVTIQQGTPAPNLPRAVLKEEQRLGNDLLHRFMHFDTASIFHQPTDTYLT